MLSMCSYASGIGFAVILDIYFGISLLGVIINLTIFFPNNNKNGVTLVWKKVEWKRTLMPVTRIVAGPGPSTTSFELTAPCFPPW